MRHSIYHRDGTSTTESSESFDWKSLPIALTVCNRLQCQGAVILSRIPGRCSAQTSKCNETWHAFDFYTVEDETNVSIDEKVMSGFVCTRSNRGPLFLESLETGGVSISNGFQHDPRFRNYNPTIAIWDAAVFPIGDNYLALINSNDKRGFSMQDYRDHSDLFHSIDRFLFKIHYGNLVAEAKKREEALIQKHKNDISLFTESRDTLVGTLSHEIRTPLQAIMINALNIKTVSGDVVDEILDYAHTIESEVMHLTQLINDILDFTALRTNTVKIHPVPIHLATWMGKCIDITQKTADVKGVNLTYVIGPNVPETIRVDPGRLRQVLLNLLTNALKHTSHGSVSVYIRRIPDRTDIVRLHFDVVDTGVGINPKLQREIFTAFKQVKSEERRNGVGLGLTIAQQVVKLMGGEISVYSDGRTGSTFSFDIVLSDHDAIRNSIESAASIMNTSEVLIVDDLEENRIYFTNLFMKWGMKPTSCSSAEECKMHLKTFSKRYRLIIIDIVLRETDGGTLAKWISEQRECDSIILIAASSGGTDFKYREFFDAVHTKPVSREGLLMDIDRLLKSGPVRSRPVDSRSVSQGKRVLIVDDDTSILNATSTLLSRLGYTENTTSQSGEETLNILRENPREYGCVLMDILMPPGMNGIECTRLIRENPEVYGDPYIVALSADVSDRSHELMESAGANYFLQKPLMMDELTSVLQEALSK